MRRLLILFLLASSSAWAAPRIFYIDYVNGSNANDGTAKTLGGGHGPWKSHPYMQNAAGCAGAPPTYAHTAGDQFIFRGGTGETWPLACFPLSISLGGSSSGVQDYYGVDLTWFVGSFTRPLFDMANGTPAGNVGPIKVRAKFITFDNIEIAHYKIVSATAECASANMDLGTSASGNITVKNMLIHDWTITTLVSGSTNHGSGSICQNGGGTVTVDTVEMYDTNTTAVVPFGACFRNLGEIKNSNCHNVGEGEVGIYGPIHDSQFHDNNGNAAGSHDPANHTNIFEIGGVNQSVTIYNNLIFNNQSGVTFFICDLGNVYNNVMWNNFNDSIKVDQNGAFCGTYSSSDVLNVYDNSIDCSNGNFCFGVNTASTTLPGTVNLRNNIFITNGTAVTTRGNTITTFNNDHNRTMPTAEAATFGFTTGNKLNPTSSDSNTVAQGLNLTSLCSGNLTALCQDTEGAPWFGSSYQTRPNSAWDLGAYKFPAAGSSAPTVTITAPANGATVSGTVAVIGTCVPVGPATIQANSFKLQVDGVNYGASSSTSPISVNWDTTQASNASHTLFLSCVDSNGLSGGSAVFTVTVSNSIPGCFISDVPWIGNVSFPAITGSSSTVTWTATPFTASTEDTVMGLSNVVAGAYSDLATSVRFSNNGQIQVYDQAFNSGAGGYKADNVVTYLAGTAYTFSEVVNLTNHTYSVTETSPSNVVLCASCAFRSTQTGLTQLQYMNGESSAPTPQTAKICNVATAPVMAISPSPASPSPLTWTQGTTSTPFTITVSNIGGATLTLSTPFLGPNTGANPADFANAGGGTCSNGLAILTGTSCTIFETFTPSTALAESATLHVNGTVSGTVALSGIGAAVPPPSTQPAPTPAVILGLLNSPGSIDLTIGNCPKTCKIHLACSNCTPTYIGSVQ